MKKQTCSMIKMCYEISFDHIYAVTSNPICKMLEGVWQNVIDYIWVVGSMSDFIFFFLSYSF